MQIVQTFGLDPYLTLAQIINFLVLFFIFKKYLYPPLFKVMKKRQDLAREVVDNAEKSRIALDEAMEKEKKIIHEAKKSAALLIEDAREQQAALLLAAQTESKKQAQRIIHEAREQMERESNDVRQQLSAQASMLSVDILRKSLSTAFSNKEQEELVRKLLNKIGKLPN
jgi:F-type H+-transporting ATPase subunit b